MLNRGTCTVGINCCGNSIYYSVYRNPELLGCYEPPIPGTQIAAATYPVACFSTVACSNTVATSKVYSLPNPVSMTFTPTATPPRQHYWTLPGYSNYNYLGCHGNTTLKSINATTTSFMTPLLCAAICETAGTGGTPTTYFSVNMADYLQTTV
jgi:hypothetical protein